MVSTWLLLSICIGAYSINTASGKSGSRNRNLVQITDDNWQRLHKNEWMIIFHAPWCPTCSAVNKAWASFAEWSRDLEINVGTIDVTASPGLRGRFLVTQYPTVYHVKDGNFRRYLGEFDKEDFMSFAERKKWTVLEPLMSWRHPDSFLMGLVARLFQLSMSIMDYHYYLVDQKDFPVWGSCVMFLGGTVVLGCVLAYFVDLAAQKIIK